MERVPADELRENLAQRRTWRLTLPREREWVIGPRPSILGIVNVTPDSFSDGGQFSSSDHAVESALAMVESGADALDIGGESTRPGSETISTEEQIRRVAPVIEGIRRSSNVPISIDTRDPRVGEAALEVGADIINDVSACIDPGWVPVLASSVCPVVLMHMRGTPQTMQSQTEYARGPVVEIIEHLETLMNELEEAGIARERFICDPGIGFAKEASQNLEILVGLRHFAELDRPILFGASRKIFLGRILEDPKAGVREPKGRDVGTVAANAFAVLGGADILRVHNVRYARDLADVAEALRIVAQGGE